MALGDSLFYPEQYEEFTLDTNSPELKLCHAVLRSALFDIACPNRTMAKDDLPIAVEWIDSDDDSPWTFAWICDQLGIDHLSLRTKLASRLTLIRGYIADCTRFRGFARKFTQGAIEEAFKEQNLYIDPNVYRTTRRAAK